MGVWGIYIDTPGECDYNDHKVFDEMEVKMSTISVGVREAKGNLSKLLKQVRSGVQVVITDRGEPVGKIIPIEKKELPLEDRLKDLKKRGVIELKGNGKTKKLPSPLKMPKRVKVQEMLQEDRNQL